MLVGLHLSCRKSFLVLNVLSKIWWRCTWTSGQCHMFKCSPPVVVCANAWQFKDSCSNPSQLFPLFSIHMSVRRHRVLLTCVCEVVTLTNLALFPHWSINHLRVCTDIWSEQSFQTDPDLPPGWKKITDMAGIYYWHIPTGTTQWERPATQPAPAGQPESQALGDLTASTPRKHSAGSLSCSPTPDHEVSDGTRHHTVKCCSTQKSDFISLSLTSLFLVVFYSILLQLQQNQQQDC